MVVRPLGERPVEEPLDWMALLELILGGGALLQGNNHGCRFIRSSLLLYSHGGNAVRSLCFSCRYHLLASCFARFSGKLAGDRAWCLPGRLCRLRRRVSCVSKGAVDVWYCSYVNTYDKCYIIKSPQIPDSPNLERSKLCARHQSLRNFERSCWQRVTLTAPPPPS